MVEPGGGTRGKAEAGLSVRGGRGQGVRSGSEAQIPAYLAVTVLNVSSRLIEAVCATVV